jgi:hypothetical protein
MRPGLECVRVTVGSYSVLLDSLRTMRPAPRSVTPPATSRATSSPVNGSELALALLTVRDALALQTDGALYAKQLELESAKEAAGNNSIVATKIAVKIRFIGLPGVLSDSGFTLPQGYAWHARLDHIPQFRSKQHGQKML